MFRSRYAQRWNDLVELGNLGLEHADVLRVLSRTGISP